MRDTALVFNIVTPTFDGVIVISLVSKDYSEIIKLGKHSASILNGPSFRG